MDMANETLITLCGELYEQGVPKSHIARRLGKKRETIHIWIEGIQKYGLIGFLDNYSQAKKGERAKRKANPIVKRWSGRYVKESMIVADKRYSIFSTWSMAFTSLFPRSMRYYQRSTLSAPNGRKTRLEEPCLRHRCQER